MKKETVKCAKKCEKKCTKKCSKKCNHAFKKMTREDARQAARVKKIDEEGKALTKKLEVMFSEITGAKFKSLPAIDRHILLLMFNSLETYLTVLSFKKQWESVRTKTPTGENLNRPALPFWDFSFGRGMFRKHAKAAKPVCKTEEKK